MIKFLKFIFSNPYVKFFKYYVKKNLKKRKVRDFMLEKALQKRHYLSHLPSKSKFRDEYFLMFALNAKIHILKHLNPTREESIVYSQSTCIQIFSDNKRALYENSLYIYTFLRVNKIKIFSRFYRVHSNNKYTFNILKSPHVNKKAWRKYFKNKIYSICFNVFFNKRYDFFCFCTLAQSLSKNVYIQID